MRGKIVLRKERVELASVIARAVETAQPLIEAQDHQLLISLPDETLPVEADPVRLAQVVSNLLTNAAKYTERGGQIRLSAEAERREPSGLTAEAERREPSGLTVEAERREPSGLRPDGSRRSASAEDGWVVLRLQDTGIGIAPEMLTRIFELFVQGQQAAARSQGGLGIGLTLVKNLVEMHHGTVEARSRGLGQGSEFVVRLPLAAGRQAEQTLQETDPGQQGTPAASRRRILVVDDNVDAADSLALILRLGGHEVLVAHDGPTGLQLAQSSRPDIIFLDIGMPGMDGYEVARRLRRQPDLDGVRLVALTGWGAQEDRRRSAAAGFDQHLVKPVEPTAIQDVLGQ